jgi:hypothetical protein
MAGRSLGVDGSDCYFRWSVQRTYDRAEARQDFREKLHENGIFVMDPSIPCPIL